MISKKRLETIFALFLIVISIWIIGESYNLSLGKARDPGPGILPFFIGILMIICILTTLIKGSIPSLKTDLAFSSKKNLLKVIYTLLVAVMTAVFFEILGYFVMGSFFLIMLMKVINRERWPRTLIITIFAMSISYLIFIHVLDAQLPYGPFK